MLSKYYTYRATSEQSSGDNVGYDADTKKALELNNNHITNG